MTTPKKPRTIHKIGALSLLKKLEHIKKLNEVIKAGHTGNLTELARKCGYTPSLTTDLLAYMLSELKCPIAYSESRSTYYYTQEGELRIGFYPEGS